MPPVHGSSKNGTNGAAKWVLGFVGAAMVAVLAAGATRTLDRVDKACDRSLMNQNDIEHTVETLGEIKVMLRDLDKLIREKP
jgi:hypothetical protein